MHVDPTPQDAPRPDVDAPTLHAAYAPPLEAGLPRLPDGFEERVDVQLRESGYARHLGPVLKVGPGEYEHEADDWPDGIAPSPTTDEGEE
jgi:hypothetical protein